MHIIPPASEMYAFVGLRHVIVTQCTVQKTKSSLYVFYKWRKNLSHKKMYIYG
jgi:hypothetical protein